MTWPERLLLLVTLVGCPLLLIGLPLYLLFGGLRTFALRPLQRCYRGIELYDDPCSGSVYVVYHTYRGLLLWVTQDEHRVLASPAQAERLLARLLRFNLTWGMLSYGVLFIPFLAIGNYYAQRRSIREQAAATMKLGRPEEFSHEHEPKAGGTGDACT